MLEIADVHIINRLLIIDVNRFSAECSPSCIHMLSTDNSDLWCILKSSSVRLKGNEFMKCTGVFVCTCGAHVWKLCCWHMVFINHVPHSLHWSRCVKSCNHSISYLCIFGRGEWGQFFLFASDQLMLVPLLCPFFLILKSRMVQWVEGCENVKAVWCLTSDWYSP